MNPQDEIDETVSRAVAFLEYPNPAWNLAEAWLRNAAIQIQNARTE